MEIRRLCSGKLRVSLFLLLNLVYLSGIAKEKLLLERDSEHQVIYLEIKENTVFLPLEIEGKKENFIFDSASSPISVSKSLTRQLQNIRYTGNLKYYTDATGRIYSEKEFILPEVKSGRYLAREISGKDYKPWGLYVTSEGKIVNESKEEIEEGGLVGLGFFRENIIIDYPSKKIIVLKENAMPKAYAKLDWLSIPFSCANNEFKIEVVLDGQVRHFLFDTGATASFLRKTEKIAMAKTGEQPFVIKEIFISNEAFGAFKFFLIPFQGVSVDGILGHDFFLSNVIYIDFKNKIVKLKRNKTKPLSKLSFY